MNTSNYPKVSIIVITYNSAQFVIETLESIKAQTYKNVELIISDDASVDETVKICQRWLDRNNELFVKTELITVQTNTGISANCNRGVNSSSGDWIKFIAGDDALMETCIENNVNYVIEHPSAKVVFSHCRFYIGELTEANFERLIPAFPPISLMNDKITANEQYKTLLLGDRISYTPSYFINKKVIHEVGGYDEKYKLMEDYPMWLKLTKAGYKLNFMKKETVRYRRHSGATHNMTSKILIRPAFFRSEVFRKEYIYPNVSWDIVCNEKFKFYSSHLFRLPILKRNTPITRWLLNLVTRYLNPFAYISRVRKILASGKKECN